LSAEKSAALTMQLNHGFPNEAFLHLTVYGNSHNSQLCSLQSSPLLITKVKKVYTATLKTVLHVTINETKTGLFLIKTFKVTKDGNLNQFWVSIY